VARREENYEHFAVPYSPNFIEAKVQIFDWMSPFSKYNNNNKPEGESERLRWWLYSLNMNMDQEFKN
jgi:hypothetical protein